MCGTAHLQLNYQHLEYVECLNCIATGMNLYSEVYGLQE